MKRSARGFEQVGHFFLSGSIAEGAEAGSASPVPTPRRQADSIVAPESVKNPASNMETAGAVPVDIRDAEASPLHRNAELHINRHDQAYDCIGNTLARLEILRRSCQGADLAAEGPGESTVWFRGAGAIIREAMATLSEMLHPVSSPEPFLGEGNEAEEGT